MGIRRNKKKDIASRLAALREEVRSRRYANYDEEQSVFSTTDEDGIYEEDVELLVGDYQKHHLPLPPALKTKASRWAGAARSQQQQRTKAVQFVDSDNDRGGYDRRIGSAPIGDNMRQSGGGDPDIHAHQFTSYR